MIGFPLSHSFSKRYFIEKFAREGIENCTYELFPLESMADFPHLLTLRNDLCGLNVTIPYKEQVIRYLDGLDACASEVGAVNTIRFHQGQRIGHNTDVEGFRLSLENFLAEKAISATGLSALVLGTGGAAKAVAYALKHMGIAFQLVSRSSKNNGLSYTDIDQKTLESHRLLINTTPLGMSPQTDACPALPYDYLTPDHLLFDLVYNPEMTRFLQKGASMGCAIKNGLEMLHLQAERAWALWNEPPNSQTP